MATVVEVMARFGADTSSFRRNVDGASASMRRMQSDATAAAKQTEKSMGAMQTRSIALGTIIGDLATRGMVGLAHGAMQLGQAVLGQASNMQQAEMAFNTFLGSAEKSKAFLDELATFAAKTPFEFPELVDASKQMMAFGFAASDILPMMTAIGDAAAGLGTGAEGIERITRQLGQMRMKGVASGEELRAIAEAGVPAWQYLADTMGVEVPEAMKMVEKRLVSADVAIEAITKGLEEGTKNARGFGGMMEQQSKTLQGVVSTFKDSVMNSLVKAVKPIVEVMSQAIMAITPFVEALSVKFGGAIEAITPLLLGLFKAIGVVGEVMKAIPVPVYAVVAAIVAFRLASTGAQAAMVKIAPMTVPVKSALDTLRLSWMYAGQAATASSGQQAGAMARLKAMATIMKGTGSATGALKGMAGGLMSMLGGPWGLAIGGATVAVGAYMQAQQNAQQAVDSLTGALDQQTGSFTASALQLISDELTKDVNLDDWKRIPFTIADVTSAIAQGGDAYESLKSRIEDYALAQDISTESGALASAAASGVASSMGNQAEVVYDAKRAFEAHKAAVDASTKATTDIKPPVDALTAAQDRLKEANKGVEKSMKAVSDQFKEMEGLLDQGAKADAWAKSLLGVAAALKENGKSLSDTTEKGLANREFFRGAIGDLSAYAQGFQNPIQQAKVFKDGITDLKEKALKKGMDPAQVKAFFAPFDTQAKKLSADAKKYGEGAAEKAAAGLAAKKAEMATAAEGLANSAKIALTTKLDVGTFETIGRNVGIGITRGILNSRATAIAEAQALGAAAVRAVRLGAEVQSPSKYTYWVGTEVVHGLTKAIVDKAGGAKQIIADATSQALSGATEALDRWKQKASGALDLIKSVKQAIVSAGSITNFEPGAAQTQWGRAATAGDYIAQGKARLKQARDFAKQVAALRKMGLNDTDLQAIIGQGAEQGAATAAALLGGGKAAVNSANWLADQLASVGGALGNTASVSKYGLDYGQAAGMMQTTVTIEKGAVVLTVGDGVTAKDKAELKKIVDDANAALVARIIREVKAS